MYFDKDSSQVTDWPPIKEKILISHSASKASQPYISPTIMKYPQLVSMPSAVSNWLEEQLEARGIDAVVYTRYILSLLHSHTVDVIYSDEDLQFSHLKKEVGKWSRGRKRSCRSSSDWWRHAHADAEHIKRSAAVECLLSATDQNCEIESLVDELCEKLKETGDAAASPVTPAAPATPSGRKITPQELAEKYYAAFPPLCPSESSSSEELSLVPAKWGAGGGGGSPKKKGAAGRKQGGRQVCYESKLRVKENGDIMKARCQNKQRFPYFSRNRSAASRNSNHNSAFNNCDFSMFSSKKFSAAPAKPKNRSEMHDSSDQCMEESRYLWANDGDVNMYEDLPVDIKDLLDSPSPEQDDTVEMMNMANMRDDGKREYIPYGTNIISSIWSTDQDVSYDNTFNAAVDSCNSDFSLGFKFSSISIDNRPKLFEDWPATNCCVEIENETNALFENNKIQHYFPEGFRSLPSDWDKPLEPDQKERLDNDNKLNHLACSLMKLNHNKEKSGFTEIAPRSVAKVRSFDPFGHNNVMFGPSSRPPCCSDKDKDDLLTSDNSHFKPIVTEKADASVAKKYADGATFVISNNLEKVDYKRSESGTMWLDGDNGQSKKYYEYKGEEISWSPDLEFVLKFSICQNDKACQTDETTDRDFDFRQERSIFQDNADACTCPDADGTPPPSDGAPLWKYEAKGCGRCDGSDWAARGGGAAVDWGGRGLRDIWSGGEVCQTCLNEGGELHRPAPSLRLREDISQDGEQLLSDLSTLQQSYMDDLPPAYETSRDLSELLASASVSERKRRLSFAWSFASRLEEDCLMQMSTLPTLRSVTL